MQTRLGSFYRGMNRRALAVAAGVVLAAGVSAASAPLASAAPITPQSAAAVSPQTIKVQLTGPASSGARPDASSGGQISICYISMSGGAVEDNYIDVSVGATCQIPSFIVNGSITYANNGHVYAGTSTEGKSNSAGTWFSVKAQKGGTIGYRSARWCVDITTSNGGIGSGCIAIYGM
jgi:hypothetical protein